MCFTEPAQCCNYPDDLKGEWYVARALVVTSGANAGQREYYKDEVFTCKLKARTAYGVPTRAAFANGNLLMI